MPLFEFICQDCQQRFTELCRRDEKEAPCPACGSKDTVKQISVFGFSVKGGDGYHSTTGSGSCSSCAGGNCSTCH